MKRLIIYSHLNPESFSKAIADEVEAVTKKRGDEIKTIDLYSDKFNPVLGFHDIEYMHMGGEIPDKVRKYQELVSWADNLVFVYPLWWQQMPAMLKGFIDRVFSTGYAYRKNEAGFEGLLQGKTVHSFINTSTSSEVMEAIGMHSAINKVNEEGIYEFCGMTAQTTFFGDVVMGSYELRKNYLKSIKNYLN